MKKKILMEDLGKITFRNNLRRIYPFLYREFRALKESEITSEKVFNELFPNEELDLNKLDVIFKYQK